MDGIDMYICIMLALLAGLGLGIVAGWYILGARLSNILYEQKEHLDSMSLTGLTQKLIEQLAFRLHHPWASMLIMISILTLSLSVLVPREYRKGFLYITYWCWGLLLYMWTML
jgi:hypothetical protein